MRPLAPAALAVALLVAAGCRTGTVGPCASDADCVGGACTLAPAADGAGQRFCAYPDGACGGGLRWGWEAPSGIQRSCVGGGASIDGGSSDMIGDGGASVDGGPSDLLGDGGGALDLPFPVDGGVARWTIEASGTLVALRGVAGASGRVFVVGQNGVLLVSDGSGAWSDVSLQGVSVQINAVSAIPAYAIAVGEGGAILESPMATGKWIPRVSPSSADLYGVWVARDTGEIYAVGASGTILHGPSLPQLAPEKSGTVRPVLSVTGTASTPTVYATISPDPTIGASVLVGAREPPSPQWTGEPAANGEPPATLRAVAASPQDPADAIAVGDNDTIVRRTSAGWQLIATGAIPATLRAVARPTPQTAWIVGDGGTIIRWDTGSSPVTEPAPTTADLLAVWSNGTDVYAVGASGTILHRR